MAVPLPAHVSSLLQKLGLLDVVLGLGVLAWGASNGRVLPVGAMLVVVGLALIVVGLTWSDALVPYGIGLVLMSIAMFIWARSQRPRDEDPHARYR